jgi:hypothetical protein
MEERRCPNQILFGATEPLYCVLINHLGVYLEMYLELFPQASYLYTDNNDNNAPANLIAQYRSRIELVVWDSNEFEAVVDDDDEEGIGMNIYRKYPSNCAVNCGCSADKVEIRGRWKQRGGRVVFSAVCAQVDVLIRGANSIARVELSSNARLLVVKYQLIVKINK